MPRQQTWLQRWGRTVTFAVITVALQVWTIVLASQERPNTLAAALLQCATLTFGVYSSYHFAKISVQDAVKDAMRPRASSAFRRMLNLYQGLGRQQANIANYLKALEVNSVEVRRDDSIIVRIVELSQVENAMMGLTAIAEEQINTAGDALADWRDLVPDEVAEVERKTLRQQDGN